MERNLLEGGNVKVLTSPVDMNTAAITGGRVNLKDQDRVHIMVVMGASTAAIVTFALLQHNAASAGTSKALPISNAYYHKAGAATVFTKVEPAVAASSYDLAALFAADGGVVIFEVLAEDLDVNAGFAWISLDALDSNAAKLGTVVAITDNVRVSPSYGTAI